MASGCRGTGVASGAVGRCSHRPQLRVDHCHHVEFTAPGSTAMLFRHAMAIYPGWFDRSPGGTGTSARMAELWAGAERTGDRRVFRQRVVS
jgi:proline racemase